jgi:hypothetical protein
MRSSLVQSARTPDEAMDLLRRARPSIVIRPEARAAIIDYAHASESKQ